MENLPIEHRQEAGAAPDDASRIQAAQEVNRPALTSIPEAIAEIESALADGREFVEEAFANVDPNRQYLPFEPVVQRLEEFVNSEGMQGLIGDSFLKQQYTNLIKNHLLHVSLTNVIEPSKTLRDMYPHEMPFEHDGRCPGYPTFLVLEKIKTCLQVVANQPVEQTHDFQTARKQEAINIIDRALGNPAVHLGYMNRVIKNAPESVGSLEQYKKQ